MTQNTASLGGSAKDVTVYKVAHGLMKMTWTETVTPDEVAFEAIKAGMDKLPPGTKMFLNSGQFYGQGFGPANVELVSRFFEKYPEYADKAFISIKGGSKPNKLEMDPTPEGIGRSVDIILESLRGKKRLDLFECARLDRSYPFEEQMQVLKALKDEGKFDHIGLSEVRASTVREANEIVPVAAVEIEVSPWSYEEETKRVIETCKELGIAVIAYSPLGRGVFTSRIQSMDDLKEAHKMAPFSRFQEENMKYNIKLILAFNELAKKKGCTPAQLSIAWVSSLGSHVIPLPGSSRAERTLENMAGADIVLTAEESAEIDRILQTNPVKGGRYGDDDAKYKLWA